MTSIVRPNRQLRRRPHRAESKALTKVKYFCRKNLLCWKIRQWILISWRTTGYQNCVRCLLTLCQLFVQIHSTKLCCAKINKNRSWNANSKIRGVFSRYTDTQIRRASLLARSKDPAFLKSPGIFDQKKKWGTSSCPNCPLLGGICSGAE